MRTEARLDNFDGLDTKELEKVRLHDLMQLVDKFPNQISEAAGKPIKPYMFGSLGRRIALAQMRDGIANLKEYAELVWGADTAPRLKQTGYYAIDVGIPQTNLDWDTLVTCAKELNSKSRFAQIDPHLLVTHDCEGSCYLLPRLVYEGSTPIMLVADEFSTTQGTWLIPDLCTQLSVLIAHGSLRPSDVTDI